MSYDAEGIIKTLQWFDIDSTVIAKVKQELKGKQGYIACQPYFDKYLGPLIEPLLKKEQGVGDIQFRGLVSLLFAGDLSNKFLDKFWQQLSDKDKIFYASTDYYLGYPLEIAAKNGNFSALEKINQALIDSPDLRKIYFMRQFKTALIEACRANRTESIQYLIAMLETHTTAGLNNAGFLYRTLAYKDNNIFLETGKTELLAILVDVIKELKDYKEESINLLKILNGKLSLAEKAILLEQVKLKLTQEKWKFAEELYAGILSDCFASDSTNQFVNKANPNESAVSDPQDILASLPITESRTSPLITSEDVTEASPVLANKSIISTGLPNTDSTAGATEKSLLQRVSSAINTLFKADITFIQGMITSIFTSLFGSNQAVNQAEKIVLIDDAHTQQKGLLNSLATKTNKDCYKVTVVEPQQMPKLFAAALPHDEKINYETTSNLSI